MPSVVIRCEVVGDSHLHAADFRAAYRLLDALTEAAAARDARWTAALAKALGGNTKAIEAVLAAFNASGAA